ncbi:hypothetical protein G5714_015015 [Onychostoma macrolepis]|uniref:TRIM8/14/16/25/29/45/65 coiled-coil region domain-containing protein n=1 Tax=Onychostoma macrolepis TaxID=369639 RepID=A0A7J6C9P0_9TELE|nr:hypothetical protein G5714_015015 [Onychostoma macrolepis]
MQQYAEEESGERKPQLMKVQTDVRQMIQERMKRIQDIRHLKEVKNESSEKEKAESTELFTGLIRSIERCQSELLEMMEQKQRVAEKQAEELIKELEQEVTELKRRDAELEQLSHTEDHLHFLQIYTSLSRPPHTSSCTEISISDTQLSAETLIRSLTQLQTTLDEKLSITVDMTMDPDTAMPFVSPVQKTMQQYAESTLSPFWHSPLQTFFSPSPMDLPAMQLLCLEDHKKGHFRSGVSHSLSSSKAYIPVSSPRENFATFTSPTSDPEPSQPPPTSCTELLSEPNTNKSPLVPFSPEPASPESPVSPLVPPSFCSPVLPPKPPFLCSV